MATPYDDWDAWDDQVRALVEKMVAKPRRASAFADQLLATSSVPPFAGWPTPTSEARRHAHQVVGEAVSLIQTLASSRRGDSMYLLPELPDVSFDFQTIVERDGEASAPLVRSCLAAEAQLVMHLLEAFRFAPHIPQLSPYSVKAQRSNQLQAAVTRRLNAFAAAEINLWQLAKRAGVAATVPYSVRYKVAQMLWDCDEAGHIFCLRCGRHVQYMRAARTGSRSGRCRACSRDDPWPAHAVEPDRGGLWRLQCQTKGCTTVFVGKKNQQRCVRCRRSNITSSRRPPL
jgi:hypothetical protein